MQWLRLSFLAATVLAVSIVPPSAAQALRAGSDAPSAEILDLQFQYKDRPRYEPPSAPGGSWTVVNPAMSAAGAQLGSLPGDPTPGHDNGFGYTWYDSSEHVALLNLGFTSYDLSTSSSPTVEYLELYNDATFTVGLPFNFPFYGSDYAQVIVCENGFVSFTSLSCPAYGSLGSINDPNALVAGYWTDLDQSYGGDIYYDITTDSETGRAVFVAQWSNVSFNPNQGIPDPESYSFQIRLYEDGEIRLLYKYDFFDQVNGEVGIEAANAAALDIRYEYPFGYPQLGFNDEIVIQPPTNNFGLFVGPRQDLTNGNSVNMSYVTEPCGSQPSRVQEFVVYNNSFVTLDTGVMSLSGAPEFELLNPGNVSLAPGEETYVEVAFKGLVGSGGTPAAPSVKQTTLTIPNSDIGDIAIVGFTIETPVSPHERVADGYNTRSSVAGCNASPAPAAAMIPFGVGAGDAVVSPGYNAPVTRSLSTPFRLYGEPYSSVFINNSGAITFEEPMSAGSLPLDLPTHDAQKTAMVGAAIFGYQNFGTSTSSTPQAGTAYAGNRDVTGDGIPDLIVTFYRVETIFSSYAYATWQMVLSPSATPGENGTIRYQYFAGDDPADGKPFSAGYDTSFSLNYRGVAGVAGDQRDLAVETRSRAFLAYKEFPAMFDRLLGSVAYELSPRSERIEGATGPNLAGWRLLSAPASGMTVGDLAEQNLVQGLPNSYPTNGGGPVLPNIFTAYDGVAGFAAPADTSSALIPGEGIYWYMYNQNILPDVGSPGESQSYALPAPLVAAGAQTSGTVSVPLTAAAGGDPARWEIVGNPYEFPLDISAMASWAVGGSLGSAVGQTWDPANATYVPTTGLGNELAVWDGMFIEGGSATSLAIQPTVAARSAAAANAQILAFSLAGERIDGSPTLDRAAILTVREDATAGWDLQDASKLTVGGASATVAFVGSRDDQLALKAQESRSFDEPFSVPLVVTAAGVSGELVLSWTGMEAAQSAVLVDNETGEELDLRTPGSYAFTMASDDLATDLAANAGPPVPKTATLSATATNARFTVSVTPQRVVSGEGAASGPDRVALRITGANPVRSVAELRVSSPAQTQAQIQVVDVMGRVVATLLDGALPAGEHDLSWDTSEAATGVYVVRAQIGADVRTVKLSVVR